MNLKTTLLAAAFVVTATSAFAQTDRWGASSLIERYNRDQAQEAVRQSQENQQRQQQQYNEQERRNQNNRQYDLEQQVRDLQQAQRKSNTGYYSEYYSDK